MIIGFLKNIFINISWNIFLYINENHCAKLAELRHFVLIFQFLRQDLKSYESNLRLWLADFTGVLLPKYIYSQTSPGYWIPLHTANDSLSYCYFRIQGNQVQETFILGTKIANDQL